MFVDESLEDTILSENVNHRFCSSQPVDSNVLYAKCTYVANGSVH